MAVTVVAQSVTGNPYTLMDLGTGFGSQEQGIEWLKSIDGSPMIGGSTTSLGVAYDNSHYAQVPSPFKDSLQVAQSTVAFTSDFGIIFAFGGFTDADSVIAQGNTSIGMNNYCKVGIPTRGALALNLNPTKTDVDSGATQSLFNTGAYIAHTSSAGVYKFYGFFDNNGGCYFFFDISAAGAVGKMAYMEAGTRTLSSEFPPLQPLTKYYLTDSPFQIRGNVTDADNLPAAGRVVTAYNRETLTNVGNTVSALDGSYQMSLSVKSGTSVFVVCLDDDAPPNFEAQIVDRVAII